MTYVATFQGGPAHGKRLHVQSVPSHSPGYRPDRPALYQDVVQQLRDRDGFPTGIEQVSRYKLSMSDGLWLYTLVGTFAGMGSLGPRTWDGWVYSSVPRFDAKGAPRAPQSSQRY